MYESERYANSKILELAQMYVKLGTPWAASTLGFIALAMTPVPWLLYTYGPKLRNMSKYHLWTVELEEADRENA